MKNLLAVSAFLALCACAKREAPASAAEPAPEAPAPIASEEISAPAEPQTIASEPAAVAATPCPVIDSRDWKAWTASDGTGMTLHVSGVVDLPTPGYSIAMTLGPSDRAMPPGQRIIFEATPPEGLVAQVVTAAPATFETPGAYPEYRTVTVLCGDRTLGEIADVGQGSH